MFEEFMKSKPGDVRSTDRLVATLGDATVAALYLEMNSPIPGEKQRQTAAEAKPATPQSFLDRAQKIVEQGVIAEGGTRAQLAGLDKTQRTDAIKVAFEREEYNSLNSLFAPVLDGRSSPLDWLQARITKENALNITEKDIDALLQDLRVKPHDLSVDQIRRISEGLISLRGIITEKHQATLNTPDLVAQDIKAKEATVLGLSIRTRRRG